MRFDIVTIFPEFFTGPLDYGIVRRARESSLIDVRVQDLREFTHDRHRTVDDRPFGGGEGMVLKCEPLFEAVESLLGRRIAPVDATEAGSASLAVPAAALPEPEAPGPEASLAALVAEAPTNASPATAVAEPDLRRGTAVILLSASGKLFRQSTARRLAQLERIVLLCGRYEGVDERVAEHLATEELSIGDFVLSGGELAAALVVDAVTRLLPGALGNEASSLYESFSAPQEAPSRKHDARQPAAISNRLETPPGAAGESVYAGGSSRYGQRGQTNTIPLEAEAQYLLLDFPHYTRPADFRGWPVPEVLLGGNHEQIRRWRRRMAIEKTRRNRPDLLSDAHSPAF